MSATPRPWRVTKPNEWNPYCHVVDAQDRVVIGMGGEPGSDTAGVYEDIVRAVNAFSALLAVAKACPPPCEDDFHWRETADALRALDAAAPDWRTWT